MEKEVFEVEALHLSFRFFKLLNCNYQPGIKAKRKELYRWEVKKSPGIPVEKNSGGSDYYITTAIAGTE